MIYTQNSSNLIIFMLNNSHTSFTVSNLKYHLYNCHITGLHFFLLNFQFLPLVVSLKSPNLNTIPLHPHKHTTSEDLSFLSPLIPSLDKELQRLKNAPMCLQVIPNSEEFSFLEIKSWARPMPAPPNASSHSCQQLLL